MPNIFTLFADSGNSFKGQLVSESVILIKHRHWLFLAVNIFMIFLFCFLPIIAYILLADFAWLDQILALFMFLALTFYLILWCLLFYNIMLYILNVFILTDKRIVKKNQLGFFNYKEAVLELAKIQDVSVTQRGVFSHLFNYGDLEIQTAGTQNKFLFVRLPNPEGIKSAILQAAS